MIERAVKRRIKAVLDRFKPYNIYVYMPVPTGYGASTLDYIGFILGRGFAIEAKRPGAKPTPRQEGIIAAIEASGCPVFVINSDDGLAQLTSWLTAITGSSDVRLAGKEAVGHPAAHDKAPGKKPTRLRP